jgi:hypothetical protein
MTGFQHFLCLPAARPKASSTLPAPWLPLMTSLPRFFRIFFASARCHLGSHRSGSGAGPGLVGSKLRKDGNQVSSLAPQSRKNQLREGIKQTHPFGSFFWRFFRLFLVSTMSASRFLLAGTGTLTSSACLLLMMAILAFSRASTAEACSAGVEETSLFRADRPSASETAISLAYWGRSPGAASKRITGHSSVYVAVLLILF